MSASSHAQIRPAVKHTHVIDHTHFWLSLLMTINIIVLVLRMDDSAELACAFVGFTLLLNDYWNCLFVVLSGDCFHSITVLNYFKTMFLSYVLC